MRDVPLVTACLQPQYRQAREHASPVLSPHPSGDQTERSPVELAFLHLGSEQPLLIARHFVFVSHAYCPEKQTGKRCLSSKALCPCGVQPLGRDAADGLVIFVTQMVAG